MANYYVDNSNTSPGNGSQPDPFNTIKSAVDILSDGDTIFIAGGHYYESGFTLENNDLIISASDQLNPPIIDGENSNEIFHIQRGSVRLQYLKITNGSAPDGGAIYNAGDILSIANCIFIGNNATGASPHGNGGAILSGPGNLTVTGCTFEGNSSTDDGAVISVGIAGGTVIITESSFEGNTAKGDGGGAIDCVSNKLNVSDSTFANNLGGAGGAINYGKGTLTVTGSTFTGNTAIFYGGAIYNTGKMTVTGSTFIGNKVTGHGTQGGAIINSGGSANVNFNRIVGNISWGNNAIFNSGSLDATLNLWGSNNPDFGFLVSGGVNTDPWIVLTISVTESKFPPVNWPKNMPYHPLPQFIVDLLHINTPNAPELNPANGVVPYTGPANFVVNNDPIPNINFLDGYATWGGGGSEGIEPGIKKLDVSATVDSQNVSIKWTGTL
jgi:autotransporter family porin